MNNEMQLKKLKGYRIAPARGNKAVKYNAELQRHVLVIHPADYRPKLQVTYIKGLVLPIYVAFVSNNKRLFTD
jgi:hypothetical protein